MVKVSKPLLPGRFIYFDIAQYECTALRQPEGEQKVYVVVTLNKQHWAEFIVEPELTTAAIRTMTARRIFFSKTDTEGAHL